MHISYINNQDCFSIWVYLVGQLHPFFHSQPDAKAWKKIYYRERLNKYLLAFCGSQFYVLVEGEYV